MQKTIAVVVVMLVLAIGAAKADCPSYVVCPHEGNELWNTYQCKYGSAGQTCKFEHSGSPKHTFWISCK